MEWRTFEVGEGDIRNKNNKRHEVHGPFEIGHERIVFIGPNLPMLQEDDPDVRH